MEMIYIEHNLEFETDENYRTLTGGRRWWGGGGRGGGSGVDRNFVCTEMQMFCFGEDFREDFGEDWLLTQYFNIST